MLSHKFILSGENNFKRVKDLGEKIRSRSLGASFINEEKDYESKFGFIVSNKISNSAVERNRIKRAMKEAVRKSLPQVKTGLTLVFFANQSATKQNSLDIEEEVNGVLSKIKLG
jgi:ribonuclease P protein component